MRAGRLGVRYDVAATLRGSGELVAPGELLDGFVGLANAPNERIVAFAEEHGVLGTCEHGLPEAPGHLLEQAPWVCNRPGGLEPYEDWRHWAKTAAAVLEVAEAVAARQVATADAWASTLALAYNGVPALALDRDRERQYDVPPGLEAKRVLVAQAVTRWMEGGRVGLGLEWTRQRRPHIVIGRYGPAHGLFGAVGVELALRCSRGERLVACGGCGTPTAPTRTPRPGQTRSFCPDCRAQGVPARLANRDRRARERAASDERQ